MTIALFYDTETTGLPLFKEPSHHPDQPHIVQLGAVLVNLDTRIVLATLDVIVKPDDWVIPEETAKIHGITQERAMDEGIPEADAIDKLLDMWGTRLRIGHNEQFDARILRIGLQRFIDQRTPGDKPMSDIWKAGDAHCTAQLAKPHCKCPPTEKMKKAGFNTYKTPNLGEAYRHFTGLELEGAHNAMADVLGCMAVYFGVQDAKRQAQAATA